MTTYYANFEISTELVVRECSVGVTIVATTTVGELIGRLEGDFEYDPATDGFSGNADYLSASAEGETCTETVAASLVPDSQI